MPTIALNIFTNSNASAPDTTIIEKTYRSFCETFGTYNPTIYIDSHPNIKKSMKYFLALQKIFGRGTPIICTESLSDGYIRSIKNSTADYLFQLEGDWQFIPENIHHSLYEIIAIMQSEGLYHFRFNKRENKVAVWDKIMIEKKAESDKNFRYCITNNVSNNPHIIDRKKYAEEIARHIRVVPGSLGIEREINATGKYFSGIYGGLNHPATIIHLDGRRTK